MTIEILYGKIIRHIFRWINPIKKLFIRTECKVHLFNNAHAMNLLKKYDFDQEYEFFKKYRYAINKGSVWADQNFKSSSHFYNPKYERGLFGHSTSKELVNIYYAKAIRYYPTNMPKSMFYFGACIHIIQDLTVPQHVTVRLLSNHRQYENFVKYTYDLVKEYVSEEPPIVLDKISRYVDYNARIALKIDHAYHKVLPLKMRYYKTTLSILPLAQSTSAGCMLLLYNDLKINQ